MPTQRLSMRRIKQLLTMHFGAGASTLAIGRELGIAPSTVREAPPIIALTKALST